MFATDRRSSGQLLQRVEQLRVKVPPPVRVLEVGNVPPVTSGSCVGVQVPSDTETLGSADRPQKSVLHEISHIPDVPILHVVAPICAGASAATITSADTPGLSEGLTPATGRKSFLGSPPLPILRGTPPVSSSPPAFARVRIRPPSGVLRSTPCVHRPRCPPSTFRQSRNVDITKILGHFAQEFTERGLRYCIRVRNRRIAGGNTSSRPPAPLAAFESDLITSPLEPLIHLEANPDAVVKLEWIEERTICRPECGS